MAKISEQIRHLRNERGLTQHDLALQSGLSYSFINQLERGKASVRMDALAKLADVFGLEVTLTPKMSSSLQESRGSR